MNTADRFPANKALMQDYGLLSALMKQASLDWVVVETNPNCEARAQSSVSATGAIAYVPMIPPARKARSGKKRKDNSRLMFPRYMFVGLNVTEGQTCDQVRGCDGVEKILATTKEAAPHRVPVREMLRILETAREAQVGKKNLSGQLFSIGGDVIMVAGVGATLRGVVREIKPGSGALKVELQAFGRLTKATVPVDKISLS